MPVTSLPFDADDVLARLAEEVGPAALTGLPPAEVSALAAASGTDTARLKRWLKRRLAGEPLAHILGQFCFRGLTLAIDKRAYVTDPELIYLVEAVLSRARVLAAEFDRPLVIAELGVGCGSLSLALKHALPRAELVGLDLDPDALVLAAQNAADLGLALRLIESDLFDSWPDDLPAPDLIFGDPPWGDADTLYAPDRSAQHYHAMPPAAAFPLGGRTGVHAQILRAVQQRRWPSEIWLNGGVLPPDELLAVARKAGASEQAVLTPAPQLSLLRCRFAETDVS